MVTVRAMDDVPQWRRWFSAKIPWILIYLLMAYGLYVNRTHDRQLRRHIIILNNHVQWMEQVTSTLRDTSSNPWSRDDSFETWRQFFRDNPNLVEPENFEPKKLDSKQFDFPEPPSFE
jgi:hypothetical protein